MLNCWNVFAVVTFRVLLSKLWSVVCSTDLMYIRNCAIQHVQFLGSVATSHITQISTDYCKLYRNGCIAGNFRGAKYSWWNNIVCGSYFRDDAPLHCSIRSWVKNSWSIVFNHENHELPPGYYVDETCWQFKGNKKPMFFNRLSLLYDSRSFPIPDSDNVIR